MREQGEDLAFAKAPSQRGRGPALDEATKLARWALIEREHEHGFSHADIGRHLGVSASRIGHEMQEMRAAGRVLA